MRTYSNKKVRGERRKNEKTYANEKGVNSVRDIPLLLELAFWDNGS
jgi:hypothetical protein